MGRRSWFLAVAAFLLIGVAELCFVPFLTVAQLLQLGS